MSGPQPFTFLEFFAGGGMARLGLETEFRCVFANDLDPKKCAAYRANFGDTHLIEADVADLHTIDIPSADLAWASFPCQDLSLAGGRRGMKAARSGTFWAFWSHIEAMRAAGRAPRVVVIENVTGLLTSNNGADFQALIAAMHQGGYDVGGLVLDAAEFVPQSRPRLFVIAWDRQRAIAPATANEPGRLIARAIAGLPGDLRAAWSNLQGPQPQRRNSDLSALIETDLPEKVWRSDTELTKLLGQMTELHRARVDAAIQANTLRVGAVYRRIRKGEQRAEVRYDGLAGCIRTLKGGSSRQLLLISEGGKLRLRPMQPREAARLMGLPDSYVLPKRATAAISLCGDGVCVPVVQWLSRHILLPLLKISPERLDPKIKLSRD